MSTRHSLTWLITGASSGLGMSLATEALKAGHKVVGATPDVCCSALEPPRINCLRKFLTDTVNVRAIFLSKMTIMIKQAKG